MFPEFQAVPIQCWEEQAKLGTYRPFLCLQGDSAAAGRLLDALAKLEQLDVGSKLTVDLQPHDRPKGCLAIRLILSEPSDELKQMSLTREGQTAAFEFTPEGLARFCQAVETWRDGGEDFGVHPHPYPKKATGTQDRASGEVWFWTLWMEP